ncbi:hypothetical protein ACHAXA_007543 [Cyclostephanos tholiformis]|uniref:F-box domain-containing protein n=1 Tax=Cyclostephanos tholiformis TaxID=382380 RepID=A0ABD3SRQ1_9STRA
MEVTINDRKRKAEEHVASATEHRRNHHGRIEVSRFIGMQDKSSTTSPSMGVEDNAACSSRLVAPRPHVDVHSNLPASSPSDVAAADALGRGKREDDDDVESTETPACFAHLPIELFCNVIAYLGPTSSSLCALCQLSKHHNAIMTSIGDVMLHRARLRFRVPLVPGVGSIDGNDDDDDGIASRVIMESSVSLFVRHARSSKAVHDRLVALEGILGKEFPSLVEHEDGGDASPTKPRPILASDAIGISESDPPPSSSSRDDGRWDASSRLRRDSNIVEPSEVGHALNIALCLLGRPNPDYFDDPDEANAISYHASTTALEWRVMTLCGTIGVRAYKYAKSRMCRRYDREDELFYDAYHAVTDRMVPSHHRRRTPFLREDDDDVYYDEEDDDDVDDDDTVDPGDIEAEEDMMLLDKASLVMQHVFLREQNAARRHGTDSFLG